ncbi:MAG: hypothetical protein QOJ50_340 [Cryptosporangiaceae bacterium]|nr:hypothetical protein [Cryptosporangiaceae bacterium]
MLHEADGGATLAQLARTGLARSTLADAVVALAGRGFVTVRTRAGAGLSGEELRVLVDDPGSWALSAHTVTVEVTDAGAQYL